MIELLLSIFAYFFVVVAFGLGVMFIIMVVAASWPKSKRDVSVFLVMMFLIAGFVWALFYLGTM